MVGENFSSFSSLVVAVLVWFIVVKLVYTFLNFFRIELRMQPQEFEKIVHLEPSPQPTNSFPRKYNQNKAKLSSAPIEAFTFYTSSIFFPLYPAGLYFFCLDCGVYKSKVSFPRSNARCVNGDTQYCGLFASF